MSSVCDTFFNDFPVQIVKLMFLLFPFFLLICNRDSEIN